MKKTRAYITGFVLSILLTLAAYFSVVNHLFQESVLVIVIFFLAVVQLIVQLVYFLHLLDRKDEQKDWKIIIFISTISIILVIIIGSVWIMNNLNYHMTPQEMNNYIIEQDGF